MSQKIIKFAVNSGIREFNPNGTERSGMTYSCEYFDSLDEAENFCRREFDALKNELNCQRHKHGFEQQAFAYVMPEIFDPEAEEDVGEDYWNRNDPDLDWDRIEKLSFEADRA